jgi:hypothetical protein
LCISLINLNKLLIYSAINCLILHNMNYLNLKPFIMGNFITKNIAKFFFVISLAFASINTAKAQPWTYDFGTGTGTFTSATASTTFLPTPSSGTARVRVGTNPGSMVLANSGLASIGTNTELQITSNTGSASTTKFSIHDYTAAKTGYVKFKLVINGGTNGVYKFSLGDGGTFSDNNAMNVAQVFAGIEWTLGAANAITYRVLNGGTYGNTGITNSTTLFTQSTSNVYDIEVYANNTTSTTTYYRSGTSYSLTNARWDLWVNGTREGNNLVKGNLGADVNIDSYAFNHQNSVTSPGTIYLDDLEYANSLPCVPPSTQVASIVLGGITTSAMNVNWTNGNGAGRVVYMNTTNTFTAPADGGSPSANLVYGGGQQCIFNGTGSGPITVTGLSASTQYYFRAYEYCSASRNYQTATATNNPNNATTLAGGSPTLSATALTAFGSQCVAGTYGPNSFTITGTTLTLADVTVSALSGYEFSTVAGGPYSSSLTLTQAGGAYSQDIYVRFIPSSAIAFNGNIVVGGGGASSINVAASGTGINGTVAVTTATATSVLTTTASSGGNTLSTTCGTITAKGVVWGLAANPTVPSVNSTNDGTGTANYTSSITGLTAGTTYNYRAYTTNSNGVTAYGANLTFTTLKLEPSNFATAFTCGTTTTTDIPLTWTAATGAVLPDGYLIKWSSTSYAAIADPTDATAEANGATTQNVVGTSYTVTGLTSGTTYYFKIWSYTNAGSNIDYKLTGEPQTTCATLTGPCLTETFESLTPPPAGWTYTGVTHSTNNPRNGARNAMFNADNEAMVSPLIANPSTVSFWWRRSGTAPGTPTFTVSVGPSASGPWTQIGSTISSFTTTYQQFFEDISTYTNIYIQVLHNRSSGASEVYIDDFDVFCSSVCVTPTTTLTLTASNTTVNGADFSWTGADGDGTMLVIRATANANLAPTSGTAYTPNTNFASAGQINVNNRVVHRAAGTSVTGITGLTAETQYTATAYNYNNLDDCYQLALPANTSFYTLSVEPTAHAASFTSAAFAFNQINLTFSAASTITNADGYIILQRTAAAPTGLPSDANAYIVGNAIGDATVAAIITNAATTTAAITGLVASTQYYFTLIPFNWNGSIAATYNYRTAATIPVTNATTLVQPSTSSDIIASAGYTYNSNINYLTHQIATITNTANSLDLFRFDIRDGGGVADGDALPTILNAITFNVTNIANIRTAALFNANALVSASPVINYGGGTISFSGLSGINVTAADGGINTLTLRVSFLNTVTDNSQMQITIAAANSTAAGASTSSLFSSFASVVSSTVADRNRIEVSADRLAFVQQPTETGVSATMTPAVTVEGRDVNGNRDLDYTGSIDITSTGTLTVSPANATAIAGLATFSGLIHTVAQTSRVLTATTTGLAFSNSVNSANFDITTVPSNSYRTTSAGTWTSGGGTATWERLIAGTWTANSAPVFSSTNNIYIRHAVSITGSTSASSIIVENGGTLTNSSSCTYGGTLCRVENGGTLQINASVTISGDFIVLDGGTVNINFAFGNPSTSIWNGTETFHPNSNLVIQNWDFTNDFLIPDNTSISTNTFSGYTAVFGNVIIDAGANTTTWVMLASGTNINLAHGNLEFISNTGNINLATTGTVTTGIGGDFYVDDLYTGTNVIQLKTSGTLNFTIKGNFQHDAATVRVHAGSAAGASTVLNIDGDMNITPSAVVDFNSTVSVNASSTINLKGDLTGTGSGLLNNTNSSSLGNFNFVGTGDGLTAATTQTIDIASTSANENRYINFNILSGAYVRLIIRDFELGTNSGVYVQDGAIFDFGFNGTTPLNVTISGVQSGTVFQSLQGSTLKITSVDGITTTAGVGNVRTVPSNRSFNQTAIFHYIGRANQVTGNGVTNGSTGKIMICELDNNTLTLTPSNNIAFSNGTTITPFGGRLEIRKGIVIETSLATVTGTGRLVMTDGTFRTSILSTTLPQLSNYSNYSLTGGTVELNGNGAQTISGAPNGGYYNLAVTNAGTKTVTSGFSIANNLFISNGVFDPVNNGIIGNAGVTMTGGRFRMSILNQTLPQLTGIATPYSLTGGTIELYGSNNSQTQSLRGTDGNSANINYFNIDLNSLGANVNQASANVVAGAGFGLAGVMTVFSPTCFQLGSGFIITDAGVNSTFDLQAGATLKFGGSLALSGASGNIRTDVRNFPTTASYGFTGSASPQSVGIGLPSTMVNMYVDKDAASNRVLFTQFMNVTNSLNLYLGKLDLNGVNLTLGTTSGNGVVNGASLNSYIITWDGSANGNIVHQVNNNNSYLFPVGDLNDYTPATVTITAGTLTSATLTCAVKDAVHPNLGTSTNYLSRYWSVEPTGITNPVYNILYSYASASDEVGVPANLWPFKHNSNGWIGCTGSGSVSMMGSGNFNPGTRTFTWNNLYSFSDFTGNGNGSPLPISLLSFEATPILDVVKLDWATLTETNNDYFTIERTKNGLNFEAIAKVFGAGNSNDMINYSLYDENPFNGLSYYRLTQTDFDGKQTFSDLKAVNFNASHLNLNKPVVQYANGRLIVKTNFEFKQNLKIEIIALDGRIIYSNEIDVPSSLNTLQIEALNLANGLYNISVIGENVYTEKIAVIK